MHLTSDLQIKGQIRDMLGANASLLIGTCMRNQERTITTFAHDAERILQLFKSGKIVVFENDSIDGTRQKLTYWAQHNSAVHIIKSHALHGIRTERLAECRNHLFNRAVRAHVDVFISMDSDYHIPINVDAVLKSMLMMGDLTAVFATSEYYYYDYWALRHPRYAYSDPWRDGLFLHFFNTPIRVEPRERIEVKSAFNGIGIYRMHEISGTKCKYMGRYADGHPICEHVPFHECLSAQIPTVKFAIDGRLLSTTKYPVTSLIVPGMHYTIPIICGICLIVNCLTSALNCSRMKRRTNNGFSLVTQSEYTFYRQYRQSYPTTFQTACSPRVLLTPSAHQPL